MTINQRIEESIKEYKALNLVDVVDYDKYKLYSIVTSSTALEGSTLTEVDTQLLLDEGITATGKPLEHHLMVKDNYEAMKIALQLADKKTPITPEVLQTINAYNMKNTGQIVTSALGVVDGTKGEFRKVQAYSEALGYYLAPSKIPDAVNTFCDETQKKMNAKLSPADALLFSFSTQAKLIIIHPWQDGNKRTSRIISNYIQQYFNLPLGKIEKADGGEYLQNLKIFKDIGNVEPFNKFMSEKYIDALKHEIKKNKESQHWDIPKTKKKRKGLSLFC
ncbi:MAG: Fic family protein [Prevotellaceae bacterium]|jgi:Fic family protein|nr:Fic family protein [Prevotellaceae bacterium]